MEKTSQIEVVREHGVAIHDAAEEAIEHYERRSRYRREDLYQLLDEQRFVAAQIVASLFLRAAQQRDTQHMRALLIALLETSEKRRKRRQLAAPQPPVALGINANDYFRRQQRTTEMISFLMMEILCIAFEHSMTKGSDDFGGSSTATYLVQVVPELLAQCPMDEDLSDDEQLEDHDREDQ